MKERACVLVLLTVKDIKVRGEGGKMLSFCLSVCPCTLSSFFSCISSCDHKFDLKEFVFLKGRRLLSGEEELRIGRSLS